MGNIKSKTNRRQSAKCFQHSSCLGGLLIAFFYIAEVHAGITDSPENQAVRANDRDVVIMKCETSATNKPLMWAAFDGGSDPVSIYDGNQVNPKYESFCSVERNAGRFDLHVKATPELALKFKCIKPGAENIERTAELIVIETAPLCAENVTFSSFQSTEVEKLSLTCVVNYAGNWAPIITWADISEEEPLPLPSPVLTIIPSKSVTSVLHLSPEDLIEEMYDFECRTKFTLESYKGDATARNVPDYTDSCQIKYDAQKYRGERIAVAENENEKNIEEERDSPGAGLPSNLRPMQRDSTNDAVAPSKAWLFTVIIVVPVLVA